MTSNRRSFIPWIAPLLAVVGIALLASAVFVARDSISLRAKDTTVTATIIEIETPPEGGSHPIYEFEYEGETYTHESPVSTGTCRTTNVGDEQELYIDPDDPNKAKASGFLGMWFASMMLGAFGVAVLVAAIITWIVMRVVQKFTSSFGDDPATMTATASESPSNHDPG